MMITVEEGFKILEYFVPLYANKFENLVEKMFSQENRNYLRMSTKPVYTNNHTNTNKVVKDYH